MEGNSSIESTLCFFLTASAVLCSQENMCDSVNPNVLPNRDMEVNRTAAVGGNRLREIPHWLQVPGVMRRSQGNHQTSLQVSPSKLHREEMNNDFCP